MKKQPYKPYAQRDKEDKEHQNLEIIAQEKKQLQHTEENFPTLLGTGYAPPPKILGKSFANMATEWKEHDEDKKAYENTEPKYPPLNLPRFHSIHRFVEPEDESSKVQINLVENTEEAWITVESKKPKVKKTDLSVEDLIEKYGDPDASSEEDETVWKDEDTTVWKESHQTYWNEKLT
jgi:hypothetical protein